MSYEIGGYEGEYEYITMRKYVKWDEEEKALMGEETGPGMCQVNMDMCTNCVL